MEFDAVDLIFWGFVTFVVIGGIACLLVFLPREHEYEEKNANCYRISYRDGNYKITHKKPRYGENTFALREKFFYIRKAPFQADAFCDGAEATDGKNYRAASSVTVCFPEDKLQTFAPTFHGSSQEAIVETVEEALSAALTEAVGKYDPSAGEEAFNELFKGVAKEKLDIFGVYVMNVGNVRVTENK